MLDDLAHAHRLLVVREQIENPNAHGIGECFEATGILLRTRFRDIGRLHLYATNSGRAFRSLGH